LEFIVAEYRVKSQRWQTIVIFQTLVDRDVVFVIGKYFSEAHDAHHPLPRLRHIFLQLGTDARLSYHARPSLATRTTLIAKAANVVAIVLSDIPEARYVDSVRSSSRVKLIFI